MSSAGSCRHGPLPVPSSSGAGSFSVRVFCHFVGTRSRSSSSRSRCSFAQYSSPVSVSIHRVSRHETLQRQTSITLFPLGCVSFCLVPLLCMPPGRGCPAAPPPLPCAPLQWLMLPCFLGCRPAGLGLCSCWWCLCRPGLCSTWACAGRGRARLQLAGCRRAAQLHGPRPSALPCCSRAPGAVMVVPAETRCGVQGWLAAAAEYQ